MSYSFSNYEIQQAVYNSEIGTSCTDMTDRPKVNAPLSDWQIVILILAEKSSQFVFHPLGMNELRRSYTQSNVQETSALWQLSRTTSF